MIIKKFYICFHGNSFMVNIKLLKLFFGLLMLYLIVYKNFLIFGKTPDIIKIDHNYFMKSDVRIIDVINYIPQNCLVSFHHCNFSLHKPDKQYIKFYHKNMSSKMKSFLPTMPNNSNFLGGYSKYLEHDLNVQYWNYSGSWVHMKNMYSTYTGTFVTMNMSYIHLDKFEETFFIRNHPNGKIVGVYENVISLGHTQIFQLGHFFQDAVAPILMFPKKIIKKSYIAINSIAQNYIEVYQAIGIPLNRVILLNPTDWVFCKNLYSPIFPLPHLAHYGILIKKLSKQLRKYYKIDSIIPSKYIFSNRLPSRRRNIGNMEEIVDTMNKVFPFYKFEYIQDNEIISSSAKIWATAIFMFVPTGSNCIKELFMKEKSVMVVALGDATDNCMALAAATHNVFTLFFRIYNLHHESYEPCIVNISLIVRVVKIALFCVNNGYFNPNENYYE